MSQISLQIPVANQPNSSEDPKIASDFTTIQTWANGGIDSTNLSPTAAIARSQLAGGGGNLIPMSVSANTSATDGHLYLVTAGSVTITLPAPSAGVTVGVFAASNLITGSAPVTVTTPTGDIAGVGVFATSITLGTTNSFVVLLGDGGAWRIVAGQQTTGWIPLTLATNWATYPGAYTPSARLQGDVVSLKGWARNNTGATFASGVTFATVPVGLRPAATIWPVASLGGVSANIDSLQITTAGAIATQAQGVQSAAVVALDGITFSLS